MQLRKGLEFRSLHFMDKAEVSEIREDKNEVDIILTTSQGFSRKVTMNIQEVKFGFDKKIHTEIKKDINNISVF